MFTVVKPIDVAIYTTVGVLCGYLAWRTWRRHEARGIGAFAVVLLLEGGWALNSAAKLVIDDVGVQFVLARTDVVMLLLVPLFWFRFAADFVGRSDRIVRGTQAGGAVTAGFATVLAVFVPVGTLWTDVEVARTPFVHLHPVPGLLYVGFAGVAGVLFLGGLVYIVEAVLTTRQETLPMIALSIGMTFPLFFLLEFLLGVGLFHRVNYTSMGVGVFMILTTGAVFSNSFVVNPIPRERIMSAIDEGVLVLDDRRRVVDYNDRLLDDFAPATESVVGLPVGAAFPDLDRSVEFADGSEQFLELTVDGEERTLRVDVAGIEQAGDVIGWTAVATDVTALKRQQRELRRQNQQLDAFASAVSHDLRNPLNVAKLRAELAREEQDGEHVEAITEAHRRMEAIIEDLLTLARHGQSVDDAEPVDVERVAADAWEGIDSKEANLAIEGGARVQADRDRLRTIFENLYRNAVEHAGSDASVTVRIGSDRFVVEDDGPGVDPGTRERIFEYGYSSSEEGTGLGLAIVKTMVETHDWRIDVTDADDGGARFVVSGLEDSPEAPTPEPVSPDGGRRD